MHYETYCLVHEQVYQSDHVSKFYNAYAYAILSNNLKMSYK